MKITTFESAVAGEHYGKEPGWSQAPEGAMYWGAETDDCYAAWYREKDGVWECWICWPHPNGTSWEYVSPACKADITHHRIHQPMPDVQGEPAAWVTEDAVDGQTVNGKPRRIWWENNEGVGMPIYTAQPSSTTQGEPVAWLPYLTDRADGVTGHYAIARKNPAGYREVWNLRSHHWAAFSDEVLTMDEALAILKKLEMPTAPQPAPDVSALVEALEQIIKAAPSGGPLWERSEQIVKAQAALAVYRNQGGDV